MRRYSRWPHLWKEKYTQKPDVFIYKKKKQTNKAIADKKKKNQWQLTKGGGIADGGTPGKGGA